MTVLSGPSAVADLIGAGGPASRPFAPEALAVLGELSRRLMADSQARAHPDLQALAFWLRPAGLARLQGDFAALERPGRLVVPRGMAFHVPPANVGTLFAYGWALSLLAGNRNIVRLSSRAAPEQGVLLRLIGEALDAAAPDLRGANHFVHYGHDDAVTAALSRAADVRVLWGGDVTVTRLRALPVNPRCVDLAFPDRFSWAVLAAGAVAGADDGALERLAEGLARDLFWFGQKACSSPRLVVWCGEAGACDAAAERLYPRVGAAARRLADGGDVGAVLARRLFLHQAALDLPVRAVEEHGPLAVLRLDGLPDLAALKGPHAGGGVVADLRLPDLEAAAVLAGARDQTLTHFGFPVAELDGFVRCLNGRGLDRLVPVGQALAFDAVWDGLDLLAGFTRIVTVQGGTRP
ncbi:acyl-CoA reductase [Novispirillum sp. DQ9]|uniref:acyl-CoA reductase n=1 Tax=Novispirillum sp. DQ9 TaxID=3398612 RepID=UPI003C7B2571